MKKFFSVFLLILFISTFLISDNIYSIKKHLKNAEYYLSNGQKDKALSEIYDSIMLINNLKEFKLADFSLIDKVNGYKMYDKKATENTLFFGEPFYIYMEPVGFKIVKTKSGYYMWVSEDAKIIDNKTGKTLFERKNWVTMKRAYPFPTIPFYITNRITDFPRGSYTFIGLIKDHLKNKVIKKVFKFEVK